MRMKNIYLFLVTLLLTSCGTTKYLSVNEYGTEKIELHKKKNTFTFERKTAQEVFKNNGHYKLTPTEIVLQFQDSILDARFLPNFSIDQNQFQPMPSQNNQTTIVLLDKENDGKIQMQKVLLYDSNWKNISSEMSNFNGEVFLDEKIKNQMVTIYCSYYNPIQLFISEDANQKHIAQLQVLGEFEMDIDEDVINIQAMKYIFEVPNDEKFPAYFGSDRLNKNYKQN